MSVDKEEKKRERAFKKETRRLKAEIRRIKSLAKHYENESYVTDRIVRVVQNAVESLPPIEVPKFRAPKEATHDEVAVIFLSDCHIGKKTRSYNPRVFAKRLRKLEKAMLSIVTGLRGIRSIKKLVVVLGGDKRKLEKAMLSIVTGLRGIRSIKKLVVVLGGDKLNCLLTPLIR